MPVAGLTVSTTKYIGSVLLLAASALALGGCSTVPIAGAFWGNLLVLGVTVGIFFGTLALGRSATATRSAEASTSPGGTTSHGG